MSKKVKLFGILLTFIFITGNDITLKDNLCLVITDHRKAKILIESYLVSAPSGSKFISLSFIHSVSLTPVIDFYEIKEGKIYQYAEKFTTHGAGLPSHISEGTDWIKENDAFWLIMQRPIEKLIVRTDKEYKNLLNLNHQKEDSTLSTVQTINLNQWTDTSLEIAFKPCSNQ